MAELIESYLVTLDDLYSKITKSFIKLQLSDYTEDTVKLSSELTVTGNRVLNHLKMQIRNLETLLAECSNFTDEVVEELSGEAKQTEYVYATKNGMLGYPGKEFIADVSKYMMKGRHEEQKPEPTALKVESKHLIQEIGYSLKLPSVEKLTEIPPALYFHNGGVYMRLPNNNLAKIPFPEVVDSKKEYERKHSIRCKYQTKAECDAQRQKMAKIHSSQVRVCNYAHTGDQLIKIGYPSRCPSVPNFGNPKTMSQDIKYVSTPDIKNTLMYGLSDIMSAVVYFDYFNIKDISINNLEMF